MSSGDATIPATRRPRKSTSGSSPKKSMDKENATVDLASTLASNRKKSRSKSMGPGGLDVLKSGTGNRRVSLAAPGRPPPRSILKPTIPPLPEIPPHKSKRAGTPGDQDGRADAPSVSGTQTLSNPFSLDESADSSATKIALRTEEEQQAAAREREDREKAKLEQEVNEKREARRKSLANRRVSFAAEATLHTFHEIEYIQDSTTSTDSTRRASSIAGRSPAPHGRDHPDSDASEPPSTSLEQNEQDSDLLAKPRDHQKRSRRSSGIPPLNFNNPDDDTLTSTVYSSDSEHGDGIVEEIEEASESESNSDDDGTMMTFDADEVTSASVASVRTTSSSDSTSGLDEALRLAAERASAHGQHHDEPGEGEEIIPAFVGWGKKTNNQTVAANDQENVIPRGAEIMSSRAQDEDATSQVDMEITRVMGGIIQPNDTSPGSDDGDDMSMDVTRAVGAIIWQTPASPQDDQTTDMSMDITGAVGGILPVNTPQPISQLVVRKAPDKLAGHRQSAVQNSRESMGNESDEDMSMELTTVLGGVLTSGAAGKQARRRTIKSTRDTAEEEATMDMTVGVGKILASRNNEQESGENDKTIGMEMTMALDNMIKGSPAPVNHTPSKKTLDGEVKDQRSSSKRQVGPSRLSLTNGDATATREDGQGVAAFDGKGLRRTPSCISSSSSHPGPMQGGLGSPAKQISGDSNGPRTPVQTPPTRFVGSRSTSPKRSAKAPSQTTPRSASLWKAKTIFHQDPSTGSTTPRVILTPQRRRLSGVGADRPGLGSPKVTELLNRRESIGDASQDHIFGQTDGTRRKVAFDDPRIIERDIDKERREEEDKENRRRILEREADGSQDEREATVNLREMIQGLSPVKNPLRGRKSLHIGSAKGLLGKRPIELGDDGELEEQDGIKRLKGHQGSPVKNVHLQQPPSKAETTGRLTRSSRNQGRLEDSVHTPALASSPNKSATKITSPKDQGRFKDVYDDQPSTMVDFEAVPRVNEALLGDDNEERIHLQDFLNMTSIRFMELTTTKRRHTVAPSAPRDSSSGEDRDISFERCVVAGACTVPMLELYQHSCRELKKYISEGRSIVREIETETFEDNPPLFREYMSASPDFKMLMDNQFKNVKTHARLLSKAMWYEWRMKLQDGLKEGLLRIADGMISDDKSLRKQQDVLDSILPALLGHSEALEHEHEDLEAFAHELADCDPGDLEAARSELVSADADIEAKMRKISELRQEMQETETSIAELTGQKQRCVKEIKDAEKIREECRGWSSVEISALKTKVDALEQKHGWAITGIAGTTVSMTYLREIELVFNISSFQPGKANSRIDLWYIGANRECSPSPATPEKEFVLQCIRDHVRGIPQCDTQLSRMLGIVRAGWDKAKIVANQVRLLNVTFPTHTIRTSDSSITIHSSLLLVPLETKVEILFNLHSRQAANGGVEVVITPQAAVVYGQQFNAPKMGEFLTTRIGDRVQDAGDQKSETWSEIVVELHARLLARGKK